MRLIVSGPDMELLRADNVDWVNLKLADGYPISIYKDHAPLVALTSACCIKYRIENKVNEYQVSAGILSISGNVIQCWVNRDEKTNQEDSGKTAVQ